MTTKVDVAWERWVRCCFVGELARFFDNVVRQRMHRAVFGRIVGVSRGIEVALTVLTLNHTLTLNLQSPVKEITIRIMITIKKSAVPS